MIAEAIDITEYALSRWLARNGGGPRNGKRRGRPEIIPPAARERIRACYLAHYGQWGPRVLRQWCRRENLGPWSAGTIAAVTADLRVEPPERPEPTRYEISAPNVMWSEDGTGFRERGGKKELLVIQDEHARFKLGHRLTNGPADEDAVYDYLEAAFATHSVPLVLKHDGGSIFHGDRVTKLLAKHQVTELTGPRSYPQYNGKQERSMRDIKSYERAMRRHGVRGSLRERLDAAVHDLNEDRPRPMLGGRTAREAYEEDHTEQPDRESFVREVGRREKELRAAARSRREVEAARRRAVEQVLLSYGLMQEWSDMSHNFEVKTRTD
ncbi:MAG: transposase [bacterium]|nr:transposase [bacterium]